MATFTASARQSSVIKAPHTGVQAINARWSICGTGTASSVVLLVRVPNGATILDYMLYADSAGANQTVKIGTSATPSGIGAAVSLTAGATNRGLNGLTALLPYRVNLSDDAIPQWVWLQAEFGVAISASSRGNFTLFYTIDGA